MLIWKGETTIGEKDKKKTYRLRIFGPSLDHHGCTTAELSLYFTATGDTTHLILYWDSLSTARQRDREGRTEVAQDLSQ